MAGFLFPVILFYARISHSELSGYARVVDGDTLKIGTQRIRLHGIDAPEKNQTCLAHDRIWPCGQSVASMLRDPIHGHVVRRKQTSLDRYGRIVSVCFVGEISINW